MNPLILLGIGSGLVNGITSFIGSLSRGNANRAEAERIEEQLKEIQTFVEENQYDQEKIDQAIGRIGKVIDRASGQIKESLELGMQDSIAMLKDQYNWNTDDLNTQLDEFRDRFDKASTTFRRDWKESYQKMQDAMIRRGLGGSEAQAEVTARSQEKLKAGTKELTETLGKTEEEFARRKTRLGQQLASNLRSVRTRTAAEIARQMGGLELQRGQMEEGVYQRADDVNRALGQFGLTSRLQGQQQANLLRSAAPGEGESIATGLAGFTRAGARDIIAGALGYTPKDIYNPQSFGLSE